MKPMQDDRLTHTKHDFPVSFDQYRNLTLKALENLTYLRDKEKIDFCKAVGESTQHFHRFIHRFLACEIRSDY